MKEQSDQQGNGTAAKPDNFEFNPWNLRGGRKDLHRHIV